MLLQTTDPHAWAHTWPRPGPACAHTWLSTGFLEIPESLQTQQIRCSWRVAFFFNFSFKKWSILKGTFWICVQVIILYTNTHGNERQCIRISLRA